MTESTTTRGGGPETDEGYAGIFPRYRICPNPFLCMEVHSTGQVSVCCPDRLHPDYRFVGSILEQPLTDIWNGLRIQALRGRMYARGAEGICDPACPQYAAIRKGQNPPWYASFCDRETFHEISKKRLSLDSPYKAVSVASDGSCNLFCIMCRTEKKTLASPIEQEVNERLYRELAENVSKIRMLELTGNGDPFYNPSVGGFLKNLHGRSLRNLTIRFITNGQCITPRRLEDIQSLNLKSLRISVSIDAASEDIYSSIRRGGSWKFLMKNMSWLAEMRRSGALDRLEVSFVVMKRNLHEMPCFVDLARGWGCDRLEFQKVYGATAGEDNFFERSDPQALAALSRMLRDPVFAEPWIDVSPFESILNQKEVNG